MFFSQTEPTPIIIQYPNFSRAQRLQDAEMQLEKIKPSKADKLSDLSDEGIIFLYRKVDFEEEHHIQRSYFSLECQLRALERWNLVVHSGPWRPWLGVERARC